MNSAAANESALERIRVVLHRPSHPGNIGSAARAMKSMGLTRLMLVEPRRAVDEEARALAVGAVDVLESLRVCASLREALQGVAFALAYSARPRQLSHAPIDAREAALQVLQYANHDQVALVFGNETAGLTNTEVLLCNRLVYIPTDPRQSSLNLAAAVQVAAYEIRMASFPTLEKQAHPERVSIDDLEQLYQHLESSLRFTGFLDPGKPKRLMERLRRLFGRVALEREEVNILRGMLNAWDEALERARREKS